MAIPTELDDKLARMRELLREMGSVAVAFSAGIDSTLVLKLAVETLGPGRVLAVTGRSPSLAAAEFDEACGLARSLGAEHVILETDEFADPNYVANPPNRCYFCKNTLYTRMGDLLSRRGVAWIVNGANADDAGDWRPGARAAEQHRVRSPAAEAGLTKADIRAAARRLGLPNSDKPASPCLSSRIPYDQPVTAEKLRAVELGELFIKEDLGIPECRVRHYGLQARVEVPRDRVAWLQEPARRARLEAHLRGLGFVEVLIDPEGFRSGKLNDVIAFGSRQGPEA